MKTKLSKWGNSMVIRLPRKSLKLTRFVENDDLEIEIRNDEIIIRPVKKRQMKMSMEELLNGMTKESVLEQYEEWGRIGKEEI